MAVQTTPAETQDAPTGTSTDQIPPATASPIDAHQSPVARTSRRSGKATTALILGIVAFVFSIAFSLIGLIVGIVAIVLGATARKDIERTSCEGKGQATAGLILGCVSVVLAIGLMAVAAATLS